MEVREQLASAFAQERTENLRRLRELLVPVRERGEADERDLGEMRRLVTNLEGAARAASLHDAAGRAGDLDRLLLGLGEAEADAMAPLLDEIDAALGALDACPAGDPAAAPEAAPPVPPAPLAPPEAAAGEDTALETRLRDAYRVEREEHLQFLRSGLARAESGGTLERTDLDDLFRRAHSLKGAARACGLAEAERLGHTLEDRFAAIRAGDAPLDAAAIVEARRILDALEDLDGAPAPAPEAPAPRASEGAGIDTMRVSAARFDRVLELAGELVTECLQKDRLGDDLRALHRRLDELAAEGEEARRAGSSPLDGLTVQVQQLARRVRDAERRQKRGSATLLRLGHRLQGEVRKARTVPAGTVFQGFGRIVRDLARGEGKEIEFRVDGLDVEADRLVLQALKDPLLHIVRNAVGHGVETPDERAARGKPRAGRIELQLRTRGNRLLVTVTDDGRGLDRPAIRARARELGLGADLADADVARVLFHPGFSTGAAVTHLSGRGMGLSVVQETVARLQGDVQVESEGAGSRFLLDVPLSISTVRMLLVLCGDETFAIPLSGVERLLRIPASGIVRIEGAPRVEVQREMLPVTDLAAVLGRSPAESRDVACLAVLRSGARRAAVAVDAVLGEREALLKPVRGPAGALRHVAGAILLEDGVVALVLHPPELLEARGPVATPAPAARRAAPRSPRILVVDDSFTTRTLERSILETHGYEVAIAVDGLEALDLMRTTEFDLVVSDVEMPRLDGFGLVSRLKGSERHAATPVIIVSSRDSREDRLRGLELGADAYIVKQRFDHEELLRTIGQILG